MFAISGRIPGKGRRSDMSRIHVEVERIVDAPPEEVYSFLADYRDKRPIILTRNFLDYRVEQGGRGAGTMIGYRLQAGRRERAYHMRVEELPGGHSLIERDMDSSLVTTWTVIPAASGRQSRVVVTTEWEGSGGVGGFFERTFAPMALRSIYTRMLERLAQALTGTAAART
jgi:uncharacterized protein YndB with AHSA1/START domain